MRRLVYQWEEFEAPKGCGHTKLIAGYVVGLLGSSCLSAEWEVDIAGVVRDCEESGGMAERDTGLKSTKKCVGTATVPSRILLVSEGRSAVVLVWEVEEEVDSDNFLDTRVKRRGREVDHSPVRGVCPARPGDAADYTLESPAADGLGSASPARLA